MELTNENPMCTISDVESELGRLASLCVIMMCVGDSPSNIKSEDVAQVMYHLWIVLDKQIKALDGIQWEPEKDHVEA